MKAGIHPVTHTVKVSCNCERVFETVSTYPEKEMFIEVCSKCHPFYTGQQKIVDTAGRVDRFRKKYGIPAK